MDESLPSQDLSPDLPRPAALCTIVKVVGSCPQKPGAKMWVTPDAFFGTLGGGRFEYEVLAHARELIRSRRPDPELREYALCRQMGQCCGGRVEVFLEPMPRRKSIHLFGAGHVGRAAAEVLCGAGPRVVVIDPRQEWCRGLPKGVEASCQEPMGYASGRAWSEDDAACIFTHSHDLDFLLVDFFLKQPLGYLGLIGSEHKADVFRARLKSRLDEAGARALDELWDEKMHCPIGVPLADKTPKVIAISIAAQVLGEWALKKEDLALRASKA